MKKTFCLFAIIISLCFILTGCAQEPEREPNPATDFDCTVNEDGSITARYIGEATEVVVPAYIDGKPVTNIDFFNAKVTYVELPETVTKLELFDFEHCIYLEEVKLPATLEEIGMNVFKKCESLKKINFPESLKVIQDCAFTECKSLVEVELPNSLEHLGSHAFEYCTSLKHIDLPAKCISEFSEYVFAYSGLESVSLEEGIKLIPTGLFCNTNIKKIKIPSTVEKIDENAFSGCKYLKKINIHDGITEIGRLAFAGCVSLNSIDLGNNITSIGDYAFGKMLIDEIVIPASVTEITELAFKNCPNLKKVKFEGNAPESFEKEDMLVNPEYDLVMNYTVYYKEGASGFTSPTWCGFTTEKW